MSLVSVEVQRLLEHRQQVGLPLIGVQQGDVFGDDFLAGLLAGGILPGWTGRSGRLNGFSWWAKASRRPVAKISDPELRHVQETAIQMRST